jgi:prepilin-type N-terminal cleavage/methylation domain-containing protein
MSLARAFTLLELMVVIAIIAVLTTMAVPYYSSYVNKSKTSLAALVLNDFNTKAISLYNEGQIASGISSLMLDGVTYTDGTPVAINYPPAIGAVFYAPGDGTVPSNAWAFCVYVSGLNFSGYVQGIGGNYSRLCSMVVVNNGIFTTYCGSWNNSSADIPAQYLPDECNVSNVSSM